MRLSSRGLKSVYLKKRIVERDDEGNSVISFSTEVKELKMNVQSAGGAVAAAAHGERLPYTEYAKYQGDEIKKYQNEGDGVCVYVGKNEEPDYTIKSIQKKTFHTNVTLEARPGYAGRD